MGAIDSERHWCTMRQQRLGVGGLYRGRTGDDFGAGGKLVLGGAAGALYAS